MVLTLLCATRTLVSEIVPRAGARHFRDTDIIGYPMAGVPLGYIKSSGRPYGLQVVAPANQEAKLMKFMAAWESISPPRRLPDLLACENARTQL